jgi:hypothetical protein
MLRILLGTLKLIDNSPWNVYYPWDLLRSYNEVNSSQLEDLKICLEHRNQSSSLLPFWKKM